MVKCEENAFRAGKEFAQSLDTIAAINAEKERNISQSKLDNITNENMKLFDMSETNHNQPRNETNNSATGQSQTKDILINGPTLDGNKYHQQNILKTELTGEKIQEAEFDR